MQCINMTPRCKMQRMQRDLTKDFEQFAKNIEHHRMFVNSQITSTFKRNVFIVGCHDQEPWLNRFLMPTESKVGEFKSIHSVQHAMDRGPPGQRAKGMSIENRHRFANAYESELAAHGFTEGTFSSTTIVEHCSSPCSSPTKVIYTHRSAKDVAVSCMLGILPGRSIRSCNPSTESLPTGAAQQTESTLGWYCRCKRWM